MGARAWSTIRAAGTCACAITALALTTAPAALAQGLISQPVLGMPATQVKVIGASPGEAPGEVWAEGKVGAVPATVGGQSISSSQVLMRYTSASGSWQILPVDDAQGNQIVSAWSASEVTADGGVVLIGEQPASSTEEIVTRDSGGVFSQAPAPPSSVLLPGETLFSGSPTMGSFDDGTNVDALIAPASESSTNPGVLHYVGGVWSREMICDPSTNAGDCKPFNLDGGTLTPEALSASSPTNAWLLVQTQASGSTTKQLHLFERETDPSGTPVWVDQTPPMNWLLGTGSEPSGEAEAVSLPTGPVLTASGSGVWVDLSLSGTLDGAFSSGSASVFVTPAATDGVAGTWCYPTDLCAGSLSLGGVLPTGYGSIAWPGSSATDPGSRLITGLQEAAVLSLAAGTESFTHLATIGDATGVAAGGATFGPGGETLTDGGTPGGAAFTSLADGWLGVGGSADGDGVQVAHVTDSPGVDVLTSWPVPFRRPLLAVTTEPGTTPGDGNAEALAVGADGEIARYHPGLGWVPEFIYSSAGVVQTPTLRGVAWPTSERAFAVGDDGAMYVWESETGLWEPDPAKPLNFEANLTAIAFSPTNPDIGYAVGKQGVLLAYNKTWTQETLPAAVATANLTSVTFAGDEAIVGYRMVNPAGGEDGGILINDGSGWTIDPSAQALLGPLPLGDTVISKVAGLPDGGAVAAGPGLVLERDSASSPWRFSSTPLAESDDGNISALAAIRNGPSVQALVSLDDDPASDPDEPGGKFLYWSDIDDPPPVGFGQPPLLIGPDPLPSRGFLLRETDSGWVDEELDDYPNQINADAGQNFDMAGSPDPVLALDVDPAGDQGWAVGGQTGGPNLEFGGDPGAAEVVQTAAVQRFGAGPSPPASSSVPISTPSGEATFALGGGSGCANACADGAAQNLGPDAWLAAAISRANQISGVRAFLYAGQRNAVAAGPDPSAFNRELARYDELLSSGGTLPVYAAATAADVSSAAGGPADFVQMLGAHAPGGTVPPGTSPPPAGTAAYSFDSSGVGGTVRVIVVDYSSGSLSSDGQLAWLASQLGSASQAGIPAIVVGADDIVDPSASNAAADAGAMQQVLLADGASAYLFDDYDSDGVGQNVSETIGSGADTIPVYGTGTLGYVTPPQTFAQQQAFLGASGFLLVSVDTAQRNTTTNRAPVSATLIPNAGQVALDATDGTLLRRSQVALFQGLARRPVAGEEFIGAAGVVEGPDPYTVLPETCLGSDCGQFIPPAYAFTSSDPTIGNFVEHDPNSTNPRQILLGANGQPIPDPSSGLFCAFNPGTTTVSISAGGLSYSLPVTVQQGSVEEPCGTVPAKTVIVPVPPTKIPPVGPQPRQPITPKVRIPVPPPPVRASPPPAPAPVPKSLALTTEPTPLAPAPFAPRVIVPVATFTARPLPPIGFGSVPAAVPLSVRVPQEEKKEEEAVETQQSFAAYHPDDPGPLLPGLALLILALGAGTGGVALGSRRKPRGGPSFARSEVRRTRDRW